MEEKVLEWLQVNVNGEVMVNLPMTELKMANLQLWIHKKEVGAECDVIWKERRTW